MAEMATVAGRTSAPWWRARLRASARHLLDLGLPPLCPTCREPVADQGGLCGRCWSKTVFIARPYCERLGIPFVYDPGPGILSMEAIADPPAYQRARAACAKALLRAGARNVDVLVFARVAEGGRTSI